MEFLENSHVQEIQLDLDRIRKVAEFLDLTKPQAKIIMVAGTNGKGSTVSTLEAIYHTAGYQVASYTSPHLLEFNERIRINRIPISDTELTKAFSFIEQGRGQTKLTYFEITTLAALWYFKQHKLDLIILEVGLGGRLDATNIVDCDLAIITTIDLDHQEYLGNNKEAIGYEKAGVLRRNKPFIFADENPPTTVIERGLALKALAYFYKRDYDYCLNDDQIELNFQNELIKIPRPTLHCKSVAAAVVASILMRKQLPLGKPIWIEAIKNLSLAGRLQLVKGNYTTLVDVSHNPQAARHLAHFIANYQPKSKVFAIFSAFKDKDIPGLISPLVNLVNFWFPALLSGARAPSKEQLDLAFFNQGISTPCYDSPVLAYQAACSLARSDDLIVVYGSFFTVSAVIGFIEKQRDLDNLSHES
ncbi:MAG: bifunctional tetrahydrofolate synthase/dihydrofolate synthase [Tatlockia sp.]|nr:bifunctional tetrahydrofolate synthase/dihydrofolate synthase [Tatlockia sp.]